jgi:hypothetical protein
MSKPYSSIQPQMVQQNTASDVLELFISVITLTANRENIYLLQSNDLVALLPMASRIQGKSREIGPVSIRSRFQ